MIWGGQTDLHFFGNFKINFINENEHFTSKMFQVRYQRKNFIVFLSDEKQSSKFYIFCNIF